MSDTSSINGISGSNIDYSVLFKNTKKKSDQDLFSEILSSLMAPPPPPPPMDLEKLSDLISASTSISDTDKDKILSLIEKISQYKKDNDVDSILSSIRAGTELTSDQKKILDTLKTYQDQLGTYLKEVLDKNLDSESSTS
ncbi:MAG: hypothetical protein WC527_08300 [Candidatus Margulisiibacteriota bacterium]